jgi:small subunit ribosomal protein S6
VAEHTYDCFFLLDPNKASTDWNAAMGHANGIIQRNGGKILVTRPWGEIKLAYSISRFRKGVFLQTYFQSDPKHIAAIKRESRISEIIVRFLLIKLHPSVARDVLSHLQSEPAGRSAPGDGDGR